MESVKVTDKYLTLGVDGTIYSAPIGEIRPDVEIPEMPYHDDDISSKLQVFVSNYAVESLF